MTFSQLVNISGIFGLAGQVKQSNHAIKRKTGQKKTTTKTTTCFWTHNVTKNDSKQLAATCFKRKARVVETGPALSHHHQFVRHRRVTKSLKSQKKKINPASLKITPFFLTLISFPTFL
jgi:hypothetical protein